MGVERAQQGVADAALIGELARESEFQLVGDGAREVRFSIERVEQIESIEVDCAAGEVVRWRNDRANHRNAFVTSRHARHVRHRSEGVCALCLYLIDIPNGDPQTSTQIAGVISLKGICHHAVVVPIHIDQVQSLPVQSRKKFLVLKLDIGRTQDGEPALAGAKEFGAIACLGAKEFLGGEELRGN